MGFCAVSAADADRSSQPSLTKVLLEINRELDSGEDANSEGNYKNNKLKVTQSETYIG